MAKEIYSTPPATPETSGLTEHSANLNAPDLQIDRKMLTTIHYLYNIPLAPVAELSTKDVCIICKGDTDIRFPMCETARSRVRLAHCGHILCLGCLSRSAFSSRGNQCPHCQERLVQDGQGTYCEDDDTVRLVRFVEFLKSIGPEPRKEALNDIFAFSHGASSLDSRRSVIIGAYWVAVVGDVAGRGVDRAKLRTKIRYAIFGTVAVLCISLAVWGVLVPFLNGDYVLAVFELSMYGFGIWLSVGALKVWWCLVQMC